MVTGVTSRGIYLQPRGDLTLYLTADPFRGPLTLNVRDESDNLASIQPFDAAERIDDLLRFKISQQGIAFHKPLVWKPAVPPYPPKRTPESYTKLFHQVQTAHPAHPYLPLLEMVITSKPIPLEDLPGFEEKVIQLLRSLTKADPSDIISKMETFLGAGPGLTPLGDDLLLGILLTAARARGYTHWPGELIDFYHPVISEAEEKTTRLSWSLLNCAIQGTGDERIIRVLDSLIAGRIIPDQDLENLLDWGSSSGMAVLAGILMALA